jgi:chromosome segregation ATPase
VTGNTDPQLDQRPGGSGMSIGNEVVRQQLERTIKSKTTRSRSLARDEERLRREAAELQRKRQALEAETLSLQSHLDSLGGPVLKASPEAAS